MKTLSEGWQVFEVVVEYYKLDVLLILDFVKEGWYEWEICVFSYFLDYTKIIKWPF